MKHKLKFELKYKSLQYRHMWLGLGYIWVVLTIYVCLIPNPPDTSGVEFGDKFVHMAGYICLFVWFSQIYNRANQWRPFIGLVALGVLIEFAQGYTGYRAFEVADMAANTSGVLVGWLVSGTIIGSIFMKFESIVFKKNR